MNKPIVIFLLVAYFVFFTSCSSSPPNFSKTSVVPATIDPPSSISAYFPLKRGAYWIYQGNIRWTKINSSEVGEEEITWKMEVKRVVQQNNIVGYEMLGAPWDLAWYEEGKKPSSYGIIQTGGRFYRTPTETITRLMSEDDTLAGLVSENELFLDIPLIQGKKFCDTWSIARSDNWYCWVVSQENQSTMMKIKGVDPSKMLVEYRVVNQTMPDHSIFSFIPGVGISHYTYAHHGTVSEVDVQLIEYFAGE